MFDARHYLYCRHRPGGRDWPFLDCWGLVREYYRRELGVELDPHDGLDAKTMSRGLEAELPRFREVAPAGISDHDIVAFFRRGLLFHVGVYRDGRLLQTSIGRGCTFAPMTSFAGVRVFRRVPGDAPGKL